MTWKEDYIKERQEIHNSREHQHHGFEEERISPQ
jgi:hypothetical protein